MNKEEIDNILGAFLLANSPKIITQEEFDDVKSAIKDLQKKAELGEHYKNLYSSVKKQKDDVVENIKKQITFCTNEAEGTINNEKCWMAINYLKKILRMLGEIDVELEN